MQQKSYKCKGEKDINSHSRTLHMKIYVWSAVQS